MGVHMKAWQGVMRSPAAHPGCAEARMLTSDRWTGGVPRWTGEQLAWSDALRPLPPLACDATDGGREVFLAHGQARSLGCEGVRAQTIAMRAGEAFERRYCGPFHLLVAHERLTRRRGSTTVEGLPTSKLENLSHTLTFVPAGRKFREWHLPEVSARAIYIYIDPRTPLIPAKPGPAPACRSARVHFRSPTLWQTVLKLQAVLEDRGVPCPHYGKALGVILAHELAREEETAPSAPARGGLAVWQQRLVARYIQEHLGESIPVATLAALARLSRYHFSRTFKATFGTSPHHLHLQLRVERAKELLSTSVLSVTQIALELGFCDSGSLSMAFIRFTGVTPTRYRQAVRSEPG